MKRLIIVLLCFLLVWPVVAAAAPEAPVTLDKAIAIAKEAFTIPEGLARFSSNFEEYDGRRTWSLHWEGEGEKSPGSFHVTVDAVTGDILNMSCWRSRTKEPKILPAISREKALQIARELATNLQPEKFQQTAERQEGPIPADDWRDPNTYSFTFDRMVQGIPFPENNISITIDAQTGEITSYNFNWLNTEFPDAAKRITPEEAGKIFKEKIGLKLIYFRPYPQNRENTPVKLVYTLDRPDQVRIDALTGEILPGPRYWFAENMRASEKAVKRPSALDQKVELTPEEQAAVDDTAKCLSKEDALKKARKLADVPDDLELKSANLEYDWQFPQNRYWVFYFSKSTKESNKSVNVGLNAYTGELVSFYQDEYKQNEDSSKKDPKYNKEQAQTIAEKFLQKMQPEKWKSVKLTPREEEYRIFEDKDYQPREYSFTYTRHVNDIPFPANNFEVVVDAVTGQIRSYRMQWAELDFPKPEGLISKEGMEEKFLAAGGLVLDYMRLANNLPDIALKQGQKPEEPKVYLVYHAANRPYNHFDAVTGEPLDWQGKPVVFKEKVELTDIAGHYAEDSIRALAEAGIVTGKDGKFYPDAQITKIDLLAMLIKTLDRSTTLKNDEDLVAYAMERGIVKKEEITDVQQTISREMLAAWVVRALRFDRVAALPVFQPVVKDTAQVSKDYRGHVAIAAGLGLMGGIGQEFRPQALTTRAEAAVVLYRYCILEK